jgi:hypothetical protein
LATKYCQIKSLEQMAEPMSIATRLWRRRSRLKRIIKRRWRYLNNLFYGIFRTRQREIGNKVKGSAVTGLQPGDIVRVRSREEIQATLNNWNFLKGCGFMEEMWPYCNTTQRVLKRVEKFIDERDYLMKNIKGIIILDGVFCQGTKDFGACDRTCFYFWREEWLEKIGGN